MSRILLVEDDPHLADLYTEVLEREGHEITWVSNGKLAVEQIGDVQPDFVLMDIQMPEMDGLEATERLKDSEHADIPIFALTNLQMPEEVSAALEAGVDGYLYKPIDPDDLIEELGVVLKSLE